MSEAHPFALTLLRTWKDKD